MNIVLIIPTGIGCEIGGHAGDANPIAKLLGSCCDKLITHPNVVNASDINEMPENTLYVEGSILDRFLRGEIYLKEIFYNKILLVVNAPVNNNTINSVNAAKATIGANIEIIELKKPLHMTGFYNEHGMADGEIVGFTELAEQVNKYDFDALAIQSVIEVEDKTVSHYLNNGGVNPWGGAEAKLSKLIANAIDKPVAHSPLENTEGMFKNFNDIVDWRMAAELVSISYLHCILKGLHKAPRINYNIGLSVDNIDFLISPIDCVGPAHHACMDADIPIIAVKENKSVLNDKMPDNFIIVDNYIEAAGFLMACKAGVSYDSVRRFNLKK